MYTQLKTYSTKQLLFHVDNGGKLAEECQKELNRRDSKQGVTVLKNGIVSNNNF